MRVLFSVLLLYFVSMSSDILPNKVNAMDLSLLQGKWILDTINGEALETNKQIYFEINGQMITGFDGCNRFGGDLRQPKLMRKSQRACATDTPQFPLHLANPLPQLDRARLDGDLLILSLEGGSGIATFRRKRR